MNLDQALLHPWEERTAHPKDLRSCINAHGLYSTLQFVLRLSPQVHRTLAATTAGIYFGNELTFPQIQAFSTYLHETVHWWQHIGSTAGLVLSLSHPIQSHSTYTHLKTFLREVGPKKSIVKFCRDADFDKLSEAAGRSTNIIVNNFKDIEFYQIISTKPSLIKDRNIAIDPFFDCVGHSYAIMYGNVLRLLIDLFDPKCEFLPDPRKWEAAFAKLRADNVQGFYWGSPIQIPPVGLEELFEGQARFVQLQYLYFGSNGKFDWDSARNSGMLNPPYVTAFNEFLKFSESDWPPSIGSPLVALFLSICDLALNPGEGFPLPILTPETFISDNDPGTRFFFICRLIALKAADLKKVVTSYSYDQYLEVTEKISELLVSPSPLRISKQVVEWGKSQSLLLRLLQEDEKFEFSPPDMPARLLFSRYIRFNQDKVRYPEVLCWPGAWFAGTRASEEGLRIFNSNRALFVDKEHDDGIFPAVLPDRDPENIQQTFNDFYGWVVNYGLVSQWINRPGPFDFRYEWLSKTNDPAETKEWACRLFSSSFGVHPDQFDIL